MKKILALALSVAMSMSLVACSSSTTTTETPAATESTTSSSASTSTTATTTSTPESTFPEKSLTLIVPWGAGGSSDLIGRLLVTEMGNMLGEDFSVVNTSGGSGIIGMTDCYNKDHDGYTLIANATPYNHAVMGQAEWLPSDWSFLGAYYVPGIIAVSKDSPYQTFDDLYTAMQENPGDITCGTAGTGTVGYINMILLGSVDEVLAEYAHIAYSGGAAAITATLAGEVDFTSQLSNEMIDLLRSGDLIPLAALTEDDLVLDGLSEPIPSIKTFLPETESVLPCGDAFGLMFPSDVPSDVQAILEEAYLYACTTDSAIAFANEKGVTLEAMNLEASAALRDEDGL